MKLVIPNLESRKFGIYGIQGSGKSYFAKNHVVNKLFPGRALVITSLGYEWQDAGTKCFFIQPKFVQELDEIAAKAKQKAIQGKLKLLLIDEADEWFRTNFDVTPNLRDLVLKHRHYGLALGFITRRPQDIPAFIVESCHAHFLFKMEGVHALKRFEDMHPSMTELMQQLDYEKKNFIVKELGKNPFVHDAIQA